MYEKQLFMPTNDSWVSRHSVDDEYQKTKQGDSKKKHKSSLKV